MGCNTITTIITTDYNEYNAVAITTKLQQNYNAATTAIVPKYPVAMCRCNRFP